MRYTGVVRKRVDKGAEHLIGMARTLLGALEQRIYRSTLQQMKHRMRTGDGFMITVGIIRGAGVMPGYYFMDITGGTLQGGTAFGSMLLESGFMAFPISQDLSPALLHYPESVEQRYPGAGLSLEAYLDYLIYPLEGLWPIRLSFSVEAYVAGRDSLMFPLTSAGSAPAIADNHSTMSGKAKYFDQCNPGKFAASFGEQAVNDYDQGIYTYENGYQYAFVRISGGKVYSVPMSHTKGGILVRDYLRTYADDLSADIREKAEGYLFSQSTPSGAWVEIGDADIKGDPIYYGAKFNWRGSRAVAVTQDLEMSGGNPVRLVARYYNISISEGESGLASTCELVEEKGWRPLDHEARLFLPAQLDSPPYTRMQFGNHKACAGDWEGEADTSEGTGIPVYCWFDSRGGLVLLRWKKTEISKEYPSSSTIHVDKDAWFKTLYVCGSGSINGRFVEVQKGYTTCFYIDESEAEDDFSDGAESEMEESSSGGVWNDLYVEQVSSWDVPITDESGIQCIPNAFTLRDFDEPDPLRKGYYCGEVCDLGIQTECCSGDNRMFSAINSRPKLTQYEVRCTQEVLTAHAVIIPYYDSEAAYLFSYIKIPQASIWDRATDWDGHTEIKTYDKIAPCDENEASLRSKHVVRTPYEEWGVTNPGCVGPIQWPTCISGSLLNKLPGRNCEVTYDAGQKDILRLRFVLANTNGTILIKDEEHLEAWGSSDSTLWGDDGPYGLIVSPITCEEPYLDISCEHINSALEGEAFYSGDWGVTSPPQRDTNTNLNPSVLGPTAGRFIGIV